MVFDWFKDFFFVMFIEVGIYYFGRVFRVFVGVVGSVCCIVMVCRYVGM